jgi:AraC-like DNA-binding protein
MMTALSRRPTAWYVPVPPPPALDRVLACSWTATPSGMHRLVPDGCVDVLWTSGRAIWVCGPETAAWEFALPEGTTAVGSRLRPGVASRLFDIDASTIRDRRERLGAILGDHVEQSLLASVDTATLPVARMRTIEAFVDDLMARAPDDDGFAEAVLNHLTVSPHESRQVLARQLNMTARQLHRRSLRSFGYGTTVLARLLRFQRFLALARSDTETVTSLARLAAASGYSDHAHLIRDCRAITGQTPTQFLDDYFPTFPDMSDPYKTLQPFAVSVAS